MWQFDALVYIGMSVTVYGFSWVDAYVACGCDKTDDTPMFNIS